MADVVAFLKRAVRYGLVGVLNSMVSLSLIAVLDLGLHVRPGLANAAGYAVGVLLSFALAKTFVFRSDGKVATTGPRYLLAVLTGFTLNQLVLHAALRLLGSGSTAHAVAQLSGICTYTAFVFLACQIWVFRSPDRAG